MILPSTIKMHEKQMLLIGPEGDFSPLEIEQAIAHQFIPTTLGASRMRTETAAIYVTGIIHYCGQLVKHELAT